MLPSLYTRDGQLLFAHRLFPFYTFCFVARRPICSAPPLPHHLLLSPFARLSQHPHAHLTAYSRLWKRHAIDPTQSHTQTKWSQTCFPCSRSRHSALPPSVPRQLTPLDKCPWATSRRLLLHQQRNLLELWPPLRSLLHGTTVEARKSAVSTLGGLERVLHSKLATDVIVSFAGVGLLRNRGSRRASLRRLGEPI